MQEPNEEARTAAKARPTAMNLSSTVLASSSSALRAVADQLEEGEHLFAFLDDLYIVCHPDRVGEIHSILQRELFRHAHISIHLGKTKMWNRSGDEPETCARLQAAAAVVDQSAVVWRGDHTLPVSSQGVKILGSPVGHPGYVSAQLQVKSDSHSVLLDRIPAMEDLQAAWLLLLFCAQAKANFLLRSVHPDSTLQYATRHDNRCWECLCRILRVSSEVGITSQQIASLPLSVGGLGLHSAVLVRHAA